MLLLMVASNSSMAEWIKVGTTDNDDTIAYFNPSTVRLKGNKAKMWTLMDFKNPRKTGVAGEDEYLSSRQLMEFDCKEEKTRTLAFVGNSENMGHGDTIFSDHVSSDTDWRYIPPDSCGRIVFENCLQKNAFLGSAQSKMFRSNAMR